MAYRNFWTIQNNKVAKGCVSFKWEPGISVAQKERSCKHLHSALNYFYDLSKPLDISSASTCNLGKALSAFNLKWKGISVECWYQGSKVYSKGGAQHHLYNADSLTAKKSMKDSNLGVFTGFDLEGKVFPTEPRTVFYDWLYLQGLLEFSRRDEILQYDCFTDVQAVLDIDACQARTVCIYKLLHNQNNLHLVSDFDAFLNWHKEHVEVGFECNTEYVGDFRFISSDKFKMLDVAVADYLPGFDLNHKSILLEEDYFRLIDKAKVLDPDVIIYTDLLLDDLCALEYLSRFYKRPLIFAVNSMDLSSSDYAPSNYDVNKAVCDLQNWFGVNNVTVVRDACKLTDVCELSVAHSLDVYCLCNATTVVRDLPVLKGHVNKLVAMIGSSKEHLDDDSEWNASQDLMSYKVLLEYMNSNHNCYQYTSSDCEKLFDLNGNKNTDLKYLQIYTNKMKQLNDSICCYDLRCVEDAIIK